MIDVTCILEFVSLVIIEAAVNHSDAKYDDQGISFGRTNQIKMQQNATNLLFAKRQTFAP